jgi:hypothetical protein
VADADERRGGRRQVTAPAGAQLVERGVQVGRHGARTVKVLEGEAVGRGHDGEAGLRQQLDGQVVRDLWCGVVGGWGLGIKVEHWRQQDTPHARKQNRTWGAAPANAPPRKWTIAFGRLAVRAWTTHAPVWSCLCGAAIRFRLVEVPPPLADPTRDEHPAATRTQLYAQPPAIGNPTTHQLPPHNAGVHRHCASPRGALPAARDCCRRRAL